MGWGVYRNLRFCYLFHLSYSLLELEEESCHRRRVSYLFLISYALHNKKKKEALLEFPANCQRTQNCHTSLNSLLKSSPHTSVLASYLLFAWKHWMNSLGLNTALIMYLFPSLCDPLLAGRYGGTYGMKNTFTSGVAIHRLGSACAYGCFQSIMTVVHLLGLRN